MRKALYILADLDEADLTWFAANGSQHTLAPRQTIICAGDPVKSLFVVLDGTLAVTVDDKEIATLASGDIVGEMSLIEKRPPSASVTARDAARVLSVPQDAIRKRLTSDPAFAARFYRALAVFMSDRLRSTVAQLGFGRADSQGAKSLLEAENELDEGLLDNLHIAGDRMRRLLALLETGA